MVNEPTGYIATRVSLMDLNLCFECTQDVLEFMLKRSRELLHDDQGKNQLRSGAASTHGLTGQH